MAELQEVILYARYDQPDQRGNRKTGWSHVLAVKDLSHTMPASVQQTAPQLSISWSQHTSDLARADSQVNTAIDQSIDNIKPEIVLAISQLDLP